MPAVEPCGEAGLLLGVLEPRLRLRGKVQARVELNVDSNTADGIASRRGPEPRATDPRLTITRNVPFKDVSTRRS